MTTMQEMDKAQKEYEKRERQETLAWMKTIEHTPKKEVPPKDDTITPLTKYIKDSPNTDVFTNTTSAPTPIIGKFGKMSIHNVFINKYIPEKKLTPGEQAVYHFIWNKAHNTRLDRCLSYEDIAKGTNIGIRTIYRIVHRLIECGLVKIDEAYTEAHGSNTKKKKFLLTDISNG
jgi:hypothetical protein